MYETVQLYVFYFPADEVQPEEGIHRRPGAEAGVVEAVEPVDDSDAEKAEAQRRVAFAGAAPDRRLFLAGLMDQNQIAAAEVGLQRSLPRRVRRVAE